ncbi:MAG: CpsD/CapB family tyrosine-protein kinase, partial [Paracoccaceae bacterium]
SSGLAESVRNLRTSLLLRDAQNPPRVVLTTSSVPGEGKSTLAMMLAQNAAAMGRKVLIVEADLRRPTFARFLGGGGGAGLAGILRGGASLDEATEHHAGSGFDVMCGGSATVNPADLFSGAAYGDLVAELKQRYDFIVIDAPPVLPVPDARLLAGSADAVLYAVRWKKTSKMQVQLGLGMLRSVGARVAGLAMTQVNEARMARYQGYGGYGAYRAGKAYHAN